MSGRQKGDPSDAAARRDRTEAERKVRTDEKLQKKKPADVGRALRTIYDDTVREPIPDDFLDLLGKLN